ncbi:MAG: HDOD domain-containing protein [Deltaproteobacteria bacterium]|nr:HDOD domain-containing protein [Deltaproteobacteria bacterium]
MNIEKKFIVDIDKLIPRPDIALDVLTKAQNLSCSADDLTEKIEQDPNLTANMLRMANSSYFGHMREISSIRDIIVRLGYDMVKVLAITSASAAILSSPQEAYDLEPRELWNHSQACAILAEIMARNAGLENTYTVYTAALLHDIGKVILNRPLLAACAEKKGCTKFSSIIELEHFMLRTDHALVGQTLLEAWGLPEAITIPVGSHHRGEGQLTTPAGARIVSLANFLVESIGIRATIPDSFIFDVDEFLLQNQNLPEVPNFKPNMTPIMDEFFSRFTGGEMIYA